MGDIDLAILGAWERVKPGLLADREELRRRLARRRKPLLMRPQRAYCLGVRANDSRMTAWEVAMEPSRGAERRLEHWVWLDKKVLKKLCGGVWLGAHENTGVEAAAKLGAGKYSLSRGMKNGKFVVRRIKGLGGKRGEIPLVWRNEMCDPSSGNCFTRPDIIWGGNWVNIADAVEEGFEQRVRRVPIYRRAGARKRRVEDREVAPHPAAPTSPARGEVGEDVLTGGEHAGGEKLFCGWRWRCPGCKRLVKTVYLPRRGMTVAEFLGDEGKLVENEADELPRAMECFACHKCHGIRYWTGLTHSSWNALVAYFSGGLLYGSEVERPAGFESKRKREYRRHNNEMKRGMEAARRLASGMKYEEVAREMGIGLSAVQGHVRRVYKKFGIHRKRELIECLVIRR